MKKQLEAAQETLGRLEQKLDRLEDPTYGLSALHGELTQSRLKIQEAVQRGTADLRDENRELRCRQDRLISELHETRSEFQQLLDLADVLHAAAAHCPPQDGTPGDSPADARNEPPAEAPEPAAREPEPAPATTAASPHTEPHTNQQAETMDHTEPQPESGDDNQGREQDHALKKAIEDAYRGVPAPTPAQVSEARPEDPKVTHGVLLLKAAGVASAQLVAHRDTWEWISGLTVDHCHFRTPPVVQDVEQGRIQTVLSGRSLIALLIELWNTRHNAAPLNIDWAMATTAYDRIATELTKVVGQGETIRIILDDGLPGSGEQVARDE
ncbi:hypothetical protein ACIQU6_19935 [Streptomyces sp. NPDC090442]|uniref:hypothetical protein n=1 Tax=Streptomyces sp. NPDC090442 TaxID=3365962 RepID=UPI00382CF276